jgi:hypothetical protein
MSLRVRHQVKLLVSADTDERRNNFRRTEDVTTTVLRDDLTKDDSKAITIGVAAPGPPLVPLEVIIPFTLITTARFLYVETDAEVYLKINGAAAGLKLSPATGQLGKLLFEGEFTALVIGNSSTTVTANVTYCLVG